MYFSRREDPISSPKTHARVQLGSKVNYTPGSDEHGPRFLTGGPGAALGGVASKNGWVYMRVQGGFDLHRLFCPYSVSMSFVKWQLFRGGVYIYK